MKKVILWSSCFDHIYSSKYLIGGINIQMGFWAQTFKENEWDTFCLTSLKNIPEHEGIKQIFHPIYKRAQSFFDFFWIIKLIIKYNPELIIFRGRSINYFYLALLSLFFRFKLVYMNAADSILDKGNEVSNNFCTKLFREGVKISKYFVMQNEKQLLQLRNNYSKKGIIIPNIWCSLKFKPNLLYKNYVLWVGNIKNVKRPLWVLEIAKCLPQYEFVMIGASADYELYNKCLKVSSSLNNFHFEGKKSFEDTNNFFSNAKILLCTSSSEGFPNTFLQAWASKIPVVTTFDPSGVVKKNKLGEYCDDLESVIYSIDSLYSNQKQYNSIQENIVSYFHEKHDSQKNYLKLENLLYKNQ